MLGESRTKDLLKKTLAMSKADQTEVVLLAEDSYLTRFANSYIHQNVAERNYLVSVRAAIGKRIGQATTNSLSPADVKATVARAVQIAGVQRENKDFVSLPASDGKIAEMDLYVPETARYSAEQRALQVRKICKLSERHQARAFGAFSTGTVELGIANSLGIMRYNRSTDAALNAVVMTDTGAGYGQGAHRDVRRIQVGRIAESAVRKAVDSRRPTELKPGRYTVVLEEAAAFTLLEFLNYTGFSARAVQEGRSFMGPNFGKRIVDPRITIADDPGRRQGFAFPFDFEGVAKQRVVLIERGVARNVVYDSLTAGRENKRSTGHALLAPPFYPMASNLVMSPGDKTVDQMVASTERGVYITRFHYCNLIDPMPVSITGMTRDGTFLIERGRITRPVRNLRFTESVLDALNRVAAVGSRLQLVSESGGYGHRFATGSLVPALKIEKFNFTGATEF